MSHNSLYSVHDQSLTCSSPGASIPFGVAKITTDMTGYAPAGVYHGVHNCSQNNSHLAGYITDPAERIRGLSPLHDSGTGSSLGE